MDTILSKRLEQEGKTLLKSRVARVQSAKDSVRPMSSKLPIGKQESHGHGHGEGGGHGHTHGEGKGHGHSHGEDKSLKVLICFGSILSKIPKKILPPPP